MSTTKQNTGERFYADTEGSRLHGLFAALFYIFAVLLAIALLAIFANSLDDFLHAPIGIKDDPPEPGLIVQFAQSCMAAAAVEHIAARCVVLPHYDLQVHTTTSGHADCHDRTGGAWRAVCAHYVPGEGARLLRPDRHTDCMGDFHSKSWIGVFAYQCFEKWKSQRKANFLIAGVCFTIAVCCGTSLFVFGALSRSNASATAMAIALCTGGAAFLIGLAAYKFWTGGRFPGEQIPSSPSPAAFPRNLLSLRKLFLSETWHSSYAPSAKIEVEIERETAQPCAGPSHLTLPQCFQDFGRQGAGSCRITILISESCTAPNIFKTLQLTNLFPRLWHF